MKKLTSAFLLGFMCITTSHAFEECDVKAVLGTNTQMGKYQVTVSRKDQDLYKVEGTNIYIQTQFCYEYAIHDEAILDIDSTIGITIGTLYFID